MKVKLIVLLSILIQFTLSQTMIGGYVVLDHYECKSSDHIVIETNMGYTIAEVYRGYSETYSGKIIYGDLHSYGFKLIYNSDGVEIGKLWIDDYMVSDSRALEWCYEE